MALAFCATIGILSIVQESRHTNAILESLSVSESSYLNLISPSTPDRGAPEAIEISFPGRNATFGAAPRVVVLSALDPAKASFPASLADTHSSILQSMLYLATDENPLSTSIHSSSRNTQHKSSIPFPELKGDDDLRVDMEIPTAKSITTNNRVYRGFEREWYEDCIPVAERSAASVRSTCNMLHELNVAEAYGSGTSESDKSHIELLGEELASDGVGQAEDAHHIEKIQA